MNRIIIIGNGFDLAHSMETRYSDFVLQLHKDVIIECFEKGICIKNDKQISREVYYYVDELFEIEIPKYPNIIDLIKTIISYDNLGEIIESFKKINVKFNCFSKLLNSNKSLWFNFEKDYFDELSRIFTDGGDVEKLNLQFLAIRKRLIRYIESKQIFLDQKHFEQPQVKKIIEYFTEKIDESTPNEILFLSFNYTRTLGEYFFRINHKIKSEIIHIHGNINSSSNEIILGYDNDRNPIFNKIINGSEPIYLDFIKSILYSNNDYSKKLDDFINKDKFQIQIYGHSCGVSDFSILRQIFENNNCNNIKIFYDPTNAPNDFTDKVKHINLMLENKSNAKKIIPLTASKPMPVISSKFRLIES